MSLLDHDLKRIVPRIAPLLAGEGVGPGEQLRTVQGIAEGAHLDKDGVVPSSATREKALEMADSNSDRDFCLIIEARSR